MSDAMYREMIIELYKNPPHKQMLPDATHRAEKSNPSCGDAFQMYLRIDKQTIAAATFTGSGCAISTAAAAMLCEHLKGMSLTQVHSITLNNIQEWLGIPISPGRVSCATVALDACKIALSHTKVQP